MKFALNWSPEAAQLLAAREIEIDLYKCADWDDMMATASAQCPIYVHFPNVAGQAQLPDYVRITAIKAKTDTPFVNTHLAPSLARFQTIPQGVSHEAHLDHVIEVVTRDVQVLVDHFGAENVIAENCFPDPPFNVADYAAEPVLIRQVIETTGCGFLLDTAHATLSAEALGMDVFDYMALLPGERLRELHVTGVGVPPLEYEPEGRRVDHLPMQEGDWTLFAWVLERIREGVWATPEFVTCEYGGVAPYFHWRSDINVIREQIPRMAAMVRATVSK